MAGFHPTAETKGGVFAISGVVLVSWNFSVVFSMTFGLSSISFKGLAGGVEGLLFSLSLTLLLLLMFSLEVRLGKTADFRASSRI